MVNLMDKITRLKENLKAKIKPKSFEEVYSEFALLQKQIDNELRIENKLWMPEKRAQAYEARLTPFIKENPQISDALSKVDSSEGFEDFALIRGMVGAMKEKPELGKVFLPKMTEWASEQSDAKWFLAAGVNDFVKKNPDYVSDVLPLFEVMSNNPPKEYNQKSTKNVSGGKEWDMRENTKDYFLLAEALVVTQPKLVDKIDTMVGKFKKQVSLLDAVSVDSRINGGKISERTSDDWTYYHDQYMKAHVAAKEASLKEKKILPQKDVRSI